MAKKTKEHELNLYYMKDNIKNKNVKKTNNKKTTNNKKVSKKKKNLQKNEKDDLFSFDNEIVIGVTKIPNEPKEKKKSQSKTKKNSKNTKKQPVKKNNIKKQTVKEEKSQKQVVVNKEKNNPKKEQNNKKRKKIHRIIKYTTLLCIILIGIIFTVYSPLFNITTITVEGNEKISQEEIISLSKVHIGENIYKVGKSKVIKNIKENAYVENVIIKRNIPSELKINVEERKTSFQIEYANSYVYIDSQGHILEISSEKLDLPILQGVQTEDSKFEPHNRLDVTDLEKLEMVLKIMEAARNIEIEDMITRIDIETNKNYKIILEGEEKTVYLGDCSSLSTRLLTAKAIIERERGVAGDIFVDMDLNNSYPTFRQKI